MLVLQRKEAEEIEIECRRGRKEVSIGFDAPGRCEDLPQGTAVQARPQGDAVNVRIQRYSSGIAIEDSDDLPATFEKPSEDLEPNERAELFKAKLAKAEEWARKLNAFDALLTALLRIVGRKPGDMADLTEERIAQGRAAIALAEPKK